MAKKESWRRHFGSRRKSTHQNIESELDHFLEYENDFEVIQRDYGATHNSASISNMYEGSFNRDTAQNLLGSNYETESEPAKESLKNAIIDKNIEAVGLCFLNSADANWQFGQYLITPLHLAAVGNAPDIVQTLLKQGSDVNMTDSRGLTPLHVAASNGFAEVVQELLNARAQVNAQDFVKENGFGQETPLHRAAAGGHQRVMYSLLSSGAKIDLPEAKGRTPLQYAVMMGQYEATELLLKSGANINARNVEYGTALHVCAYKGHSSILKLLLEQPGAGEIVDYPDLQGRTPLHKAAYRGSVECIQLLLRAGADLGARTNSGSSAATLILQLFNGANILNNRFDDCINVNGIDTSEAQCEVTMDYSILLSKHRYLQMGLIKDILSNSRENQIVMLLQHPIIESFFSLKWRKIRLLFYLNVLFYFAFIACVTAFVLVVISYEGTAKNENNITFANPTEIEAMLDLGKKMVPVMHLQLTLVFFIIVLLFEEVVKLASLKHWYFLRFETFIQFGALITSTIVIFSSRPWPEWVHHVAAIAVLLGWSQVTLLLGRLPTFGVYALMFYAVARNIVKFIFAFFFLLAGFSFSFYLIFYKKKEAFNSPWTSLLKTFNLMLGDTSYDDYLTEEKYAIGGTAHVIYFFFLLLVSLILTNLLVGLAVSDIQGLQEVGRVNRLRKQAEYIVFLEKIVSHRYLGKLGCCAGLTNRVNSWINIDTVFSFQPAGRKFRAVLPSSIVERIVTVVQKKRLPDETKSTLEMSDWLQKSVNSVESLQKQMQNVEKSLSELSKGTISGNPRT